MRNLTRILLATASLPLAIGTASSADLLYSPTSIYDWSGTYVGASVGYSRHNARFEEADFQWFGTTFEQNSSGATATLQVGKNWQSGQLVFGVEADISAFSNDRTQLYAERQARIRNDLNWMATLRGRSGLAIDRTLLYATGGLAIAGFDRSFERNAAGNYDNWLDLGATKIGVVAGLGIERALNDKWSARVEGLVAKFGKNGRIANDAPTNPSESAVLDIDDTVAILRLGVNYRFGGPTSVSGGSLEGTPFDFSGFYAGASAGANMMTASQSDIEYWWSGSTYDHLSAGFEGGIQAGYNIQSGAHVYGLEADFNWLTGSRRFEGVYDNRYETGPNWTGALKLKSGVAAGNTLMYVLGGVALANYDNLYVDEGNSPTAFDMGGTHAGYIVGAGLEHALGSNLTARLEATYGAFDGGRAEDEDFGPPPAVFRGHGQIASVKVGFNYHFGDNGPLGTGALAPMVDWSGAFAGIDAIFAHHTGSRFDTEYYEDGGSYILPSFGAGGGVHAGYNWQNGSFVYGVVGDFAAYTNHSYDAYEGYRAIESSLNWMATLRGRAGIATGESLLYLTGGLAVADIDLWHDYLPGPTDERFDLGGTHVGWTAGIGAEHMLTERGSLKMEALYTSFGEKRGDIADGSTCDGGFGSGICKMAGYNNTVTLKVGYSYKFSR